MRWICKTAAQPACLRRGCICRGSRARRAEKSGMAGEASARWGALARLERNVSELADLGQRAKDKRHDHIIEDAEHNNLDLKAAMGTEGRRKL